MAMTRVEANEITGNLDECRSRYTQCATKGHGRGLTSDGWVMVLVSVLGPIYATAINVCKRIFLLSLANKAVSDASCHHELEVSLHLYEVN